MEEIQKTLRNHESRISEIEDILKKRTKTIPSEKKGTEDLLMELKAEGFFNEERTISQIRDALHAKGRIVKITGLPSYLLKLVRNKGLKRVRRVIENRRIWVYFA